MTCSPNAAHGSLFLCLLFVVGSLFAAHTALADDGIFPAAPSARAAIDFDGTGFIIHGHREFIASGTMHYPRVPRALWRDRLTRIKSAGFNCVETYAFWNLHEPREGRWEFSGDKDLDAYLKLIKELGMYAIVRVGPYVCAEWDSGGYPVWLRFKPGIRVREDNAPFKSAVDRWYGKVMPIVAANQIHRGGAVIMVQLENEHPLGWGREMPNGYFKHLRDTAVTLGLEVPYFFSGLHHGSDPAGGRPWDSVGRVNPWFSTEFWPGWYDLYGALNESRYNGFVRGTWKILAYGGNGYNYYMLHGGTDFDTWNDDEVAACYDYGGAVGQAGDLRPIYYAFKHAALFARSFPEILEGSTNATAAYARAASSPALRTTARSSKAGDLVFVDNPTDRPIETTLRTPSGPLFSSGPLTIAPHEIRPFIRNYPISSSVTIESCSARILGAARQGDTTTLVLFGTPGKAAGVDNIDPDERPEMHAELAFLAPTADLHLQSDSSHPDRAISAQPAGDGRTRLHLSLTMPPPTERRAATTASFQSGRQRIRIVALSYELAQRTWFAEARGRTYVVCGPEYVSGIQERDGRLTVLAEASAQHGYSKPVIAPQYETTLFSPDGGESILRIRDLTTRGYLTRSSHDSQDPFASEFSAPPLAGWQARAADSAAAPGFFAAKWKFTSDPAQMGSDGDTGPFAWYRTTVRAPSAGTYTLAFSDAGDWITVYVNGARAASSGINQRFEKPSRRLLQVELKAGENPVAVFTAHYGRHKLFNYLGPIDSIDSKGLRGPVHLAAGSAASVEIRAWRWRPGESSDGALKSAPAHTDTGAAPWKNAAIGEDVFRKQRGFAWYHTLLPNTNGLHRHIEFDGVDDNATVFLNGNRLAYHRGWNEPFEVKLDEAWHDGGPNELLVLVENTDNTGGIGAPVRLVANSADDGAPVHGWRMHGGVDNPMSETGWTDAGSSRGHGGPAMYRTEFSSAPSKSTGPQPILRFVTHGLSRGMVWLNGHSLGRYPEKTPAPGMYLPECWLKPGPNVLVVFDEEGSSPLQTALTIEPEACRLAYELESTTAGSR